MALVCLVLPLYGKTTWPSLVFLWTTLPVNSFKERKGNLRKSFSNFQVKLKFFIFVWWKVKIWESFSEKQMVSLFFQKFYWWFSFKTSNSLIYFQKKKKKTLLKFQCESHFIRGCKSRWTSLSGFYCHLCLGMCYMFWLISMTKCFSLSPKTSTAGRKSLANWM